ncbi:MAG: glycerate kinase [Planctomycetaceae bacterium]|nr:glycerate kinase [Planctomycetaceae bacterium]
MLREQALAIWQAGVDAVDSRRLVRDAVKVDSGILSIQGDSFDLESINRIAVVGAGKAGAGMAAGVEDALGEELLSSKVTGWGNVPEDCVKPLKQIHLCAARPAGVNEPTESGIAGAEQILEIVSELDTNDLCLVLLSGGGSALLPAPVTEITLDDKQQVTRSLMHAGATINELNCVRKQLSRIKGGNLARATRANVVVLIISDVIGDPLDVIASGPTIADSTTAVDAVAVLEKFRDGPTPIPQVVVDYLKSKASSPPPDEIASEVSHHVIGNNASAVDAAIAKAGELGFRVESLGADNPGEARIDGQQLAQLCTSRRGESQTPLCIISGGEPVVQLAKTDQPRKGGRNQELALAALNHLWDQGLDGIVILSGGTDGEDGPTDAAGAIADAQVWQAARSQQLSPSEFLAINNSYPFFDRCDGLIQCGPTHTNVMDLRVCVVQPVT